MNKDFVVFILTHGRPNNVLTYNTIRRIGYTGKIFIIIDNEDPKINEYKKIFNDKVIVFDKKEIAKKFDTGDNFKENRSIVFARNACFEIAKNLNITYFLQLDDDYTSFRYYFNQNLYLKRYTVKNNLDKIFNTVLKYYKKINALTIAFAQGGDYQGGSENEFLKDIKIKRKAMNTFFCSTKRPFKFLGRVNEDVNTYVNLGLKGNLIFTIFNIGIEQRPTQSNAGGMTDLYLNEGTYVKSFYSVMYAPSCVKIAMMGNVNKRIHHKILWNNAAPMIINEKYKKKVAKQ